MRFRIPADIDMPDRIIGSLTMRQLAVLTTTALVAVPSYLLLERFLPSQIALTFAIALLGGGFALATARPLGIPLDRLLALAARFAVAPKRFVLAPSSSHFRRGKTGIATLAGPPYDVSDDGVIELGPGFYAVICRANGVDLGLRSEEEQASQLDAFGRFLNSLDTPIQFLVRPRKIDVESRSQQLRVASASLPHTALERSAKAHADYIESFQDSRAVFRRELLVCFKISASDSSSAEAEVSRRVQDAQGLLRSIGVTLPRLSGGETRALLRTSADPAAASSSATSLCTDVIRGIGS